MMFVVTMFTSMPMEIFSDVFERQLGGVFTTPVGETGTDGFGFFVARNVMARIASVLGDRFLPDVNQLLFGG